MRVSCRFCCSRAQFTTFNNRYLYTHNDESFLAVGWANFTFQLQIDFSSTMGNDVLPLPYLNRYRKYLQ